jgi:alkaline phosphatase
VFIIFASGNHFSYTLNHFIMRSFIFSGSVILLALVGFYSCQPAAKQDTSSSLPQPKNVIYFIGDGMGFNQVLAANYYEHGSASSQVYEQSDWLKLALATYPAVTRLSETDTVFAAGYSPRQAWQDPDYLSRDRTGSAEAATAMSSGIKTYSGSIGMGIYGDTLMHISKLAKQKGKSIGVVSSVQLSHATPSGFVAHNRSRNNYGEITNYILFNSQADVVMGAGNPDYDNNGQAVESSERYIGSRELWEQLKANDGRITFDVDGKTRTVLDANGDGKPDAWTLIQNREDFVALASGKTPARVLGIPKANTTLHYGRDGADRLMPFEQPLNESVPTLVELTRASLNILSQNSEGFFVMIEGGAIDWAGHDNHLGRMIEEQIAFNNSIRAAVEWVETHSSWEETLIIVTADHETGYLTGPDHPGKVAAPVKGSGKGVLPDAKWNSTGHTNMLVPFYAKGKGSELFTRISQMKQTRCADLLFRTAKLPRLCF